MANDALLKILHLLFSGAAGAASALTEDERQRREEFERALERMDTQNYREQALGLQRRGLQLEETEQTADRAFRSSEQKRQRDLDRQARVSRFGESMARAGVEYLDPERVFADLELTRASIPEQPYESVGVGLRAIQEGARTRGRAATKAVETGSKAARSRMATVALEGPYEGFATTDQFSPYTSQSAFMSAGIKGRQATVDELRLLNTVWNDAYKNYWDAKFGNQKFLADPEQQAQAAIAAKALADERSNQFARNLGVEWVPPEAPSGAVVGEPQGPPVTAGEFLDRYRARGVK